MSALNKKIINKVNKKGITAKFRRVVRIFVNEHADVLRELAKR